MNTISNSEAERGHALGTFARFFRWLVSWRGMRRWLFVLACLATLTGLFYAVENWRGQRAWENCRRELEAKGEVLDWNAYIPAPVPDDQNIFKGPKMAEWFVKDSAAARKTSANSKVPPVSPPFVPQGHDPGTGAVVVAEVNVAPPGVRVGSEPVDMVMRFDDPAAREQARKLIETGLGPCANGSQGFVTLLARRRDQIKPVRLVMEADAAPTLKGVTELLLGSPGAHATQASPGLTYLEGASAGRNLFRVSLKPRVYSAADYLAWTESVVPDFDLLRKALERPFARMEGDYERPFEHPLPNFVRIRTVAQMLSQRAQCYLLLGQPGAAWHELALVRDICRLLDGKPGGNSAMLVQAMIDVAITGLYTSIIEDGLRLQAWREPEMAAIQNQIKDINLLPLVHEAMSAERAGACRRFEITPPSEFYKWFDPEGAKPRLWETLKNPEYLFIRFMPRGWVFQNMCVVALRDQLIIDSFDLPNNQVLPRKADDINHQITTARIHFTPFSFLGAIAVPNFVRAAQVLARNQTLANEAYIACGLERYRLAHGQYPETLEALVPQFAEKLPHDIVGGQPLQYHRTADGQFVLYSVGWNEKDDGGVPGKTDTEGDWVWRPAAGP